MGTTSYCLHLKVNVKKKFIFMLTLLPKARSVQTRYLKTFLIEDFFHLPPVSLTLVVHLALIVYSGAWGKLIHEKKPEVEKLVAFCPFKEC
jgi:hypothetical protein